ncbi:hypothetical protein [Catalinimonas niigatensis]|uniref:hypothetical protein n=1 Tax=Catalinimonas niigatensis TaxID=1397264 RepID=UPI002666DBCC|nr:hypothetical protein [Catalinimonas niigatensis]WPP49160.1 hypothetical protein PZB72_21055 [Catalinimonas niigatensis]
MKKIILYIFLLSIASMFISAVMGYYTVAKISFLTTLFTGFTGFYLICLHSYRVTSNATRKLKAESMKAFGSVHLFYQLEKFRIHQGVKQFNAVSKKSKILLRQIKHRFADSSLTHVRFRQEVDAYVRQITRNLELLVSNKESLSQISPKIWQRQIQQLQLAGASQHNSTLLELQQQLKSYETLDIQCQELLAENNQLLAEMDKAILTMNQKNYELNANNNQDLLIGKDAFIHKYLFQ